MADRETNIALTPEENKVYLYIEEGDQKAGAYGRTQGKSFVRIIERNDDTPAEDASDDEMAKIAEENVNKWQGEKQDLVARLVKDLENTIAEAHADADVEVDIHQKVIERVW